MSWQTSGEYVEDNDGITIAKVLWCSGAASAGAVHARIIAAAPDLLAACKALCHRMEANELVNRPSNPCNKYDQPAYDAARAAILKAEGGQP